MSAAPMLPLQKSPIVQHLFYYSVPGAKPFLNIMELSDAEIIEFMADKVPGDAIFHANPIRYIQRRREAERWLYQAFLDKGGLPKTRHPVYMTLGPASYIETMGIYTARREFPLSFFSESTVSFTYPDSYVSFLLAQAAGENFNPTFHGKVFTVRELGSLLEDGSVHNDAWKDEKRKTDFFVEAQIWDPEPLLTLR